MGVLAAVYGVLCYAVFVATSVYAVGFVGNFGVAKTIDSGPAGAPMQALVIDLALLGLFAVQHSAMARPGFKRVWTRVVPEPVERSTYVLLASLALLLLFWQWRPIGGALWDVRDAAGRAAILAAFWLGWLIVLLSTFMTSHFDLFGLRQVWLRLRNAPYTHVPFKAVAFYRFVRHPLMLGFLIAFWAAPRMSGGHFLFALAATAYIFVGIFLEERDLARAHGAEFAAYRDAVPMILPYKAGKSLRRQV